MQAKSCWSARHLNIRYFFVVDKIRKQELTVKYCPTEEMIGDYFTKPLQGALFRKFRDKIMGLSESDIAECQSRARSEGY